MHDCLAQTLFFLQTNLKKKTRSETLFYQKTTNLDFFSNHTIVALTEQLMELLIGRTGHNVVQFFTCSVLANINF